jgi:hypothetical protein
VFNPNTGESFSVNPSGMDILSLLKSGKSKDEIAKEILSKYQLDQDTFERDYLDFINMLKHYQILEKA